MRRRRRGGIPRTDKRTTKSRPRASGSDRSFEWREEDRDRRLVLHMVRTVSDTFVETVGDIMTIKNIDDIIIIKSE